MPQLAFNVGTTTPAMLQVVGAQSGNCANPGTPQRPPRPCLPLGSRAGWSFGTLRPWSSTPQRVLFPIDNVGPGSARGDRRVATPPEFVYRHNSLVGHALRGRMQDELQHDFYSAGCGGARRRNRWRRSLPAT